MTRIVLFDFDETLLRFDSVGNFLRQRIGRSWWRLAVMVLLTPILLPLVIIRATRWRGARVFLWLATVGMSAQQLLQAYENYAQRCLQAGGRWCANADGIACLRAHLAQGDRVVIVTGAITELVATLCRVYSIPAKEIVGSSLRPFAGGWVGDRHCYAENKVTMLNEIGIRAPWQIVYTDSDADLPLLRGAEQRFLINPKPYKHDRIRAELGDSVQVLRWN